mmetsp:Transcript_100/g.177  ORF Transcript_100/g.177 Transcript_100/m.177 type:complete len:352 (+) Transcript_100:178-1233(+)
MIKAGLYLYSRKKVTLELLKKVYFSFVLLDTESQKNGVNQNSKLLSRAFILCNRFMPVKLIELWLEKHKTILRHETKIAPDEYFFLAANTSDRNKLIEENIPKPKLENKKDERTGTFEIDQVVLSSPDIDKKLEKITSLNIVAQNVIFDTDEKIPHSSAEVSKLEKSPDNKVNRLKRHMQNPELFKQIKKNLQESRYFIKKAKNEKFSYLSYKSRPQTSCTNFKASRPVSAISPSQTIRSPKPQNLRIQSPSFQLFNNLPVSSKSNTKLLKNCLVRPSSGAVKTERTRPCTAKSRPQTATSHVSTGNTLGIKNEPFHVMTLRESVVVSQIETKTPTKQRTRKTSIKPRWRY